MADNPEIEFDSSRGPGSPHGDVSISYKIDCVRWDHTVSKAEVLHEWQCEGSFVKDGWTYLNTLLIILKGYGANSIKINGKQLTD